MRIDVKCYAGYKGDERPLKFRMGDREHVVEEVLDQWYGPSDTWFRVRADDGNLYILRHTTGFQNDYWVLASYPSEGETSV